MDETDVEDDEDKPYTTQLQQPLVFNDKGYKES